MSTDSPDTLARIELMLHERIGLDPSTVGSSLVHRAVHRRRQALGLSSVVEYSVRLANDAQEIQELVEEVVIPETYFFREPEALDAVARIVSASYGTRETAQPVRILSAPCSTGEEPYSIAMTLDAAGVPASAYVIDAVDLSFEAVRRARAAVYRGGSFRGSSQGWRAFFDDTPQGFVLHERMRTRIAFAQGNLLAPGFTAPRSEYDFVFCRNLLIYFDVETQARVLAMLTALLAVDGVLVVGAADTFAVRRAGFVPVPGAERSFLFRHQGAEEAAPTPAPSAPRSRPVRARADKGRPSTRTQSPAARQAPVTAPARPSPAQKQSLAIEVARLAGTGDLREAIRLGESALASSDVSAELLAIVGTTYAALDDETRAEACYRRALYLEPSNADALLHLALLLERRGEAESADRLRARARRAHDGASGAAI